MAQLETLSPSTGFPISSQESHSPDAESFHKTPTIWKGEDTSIKPLNDCSYDYSPSSKSTGQSPTGREAKIRLRPWLEGAINSGQYPGLEWLDKSILLFRIPWKHRSKKDWNLVHIMIFMDWAKNTGKFHEGDKPDFVAMKTRLRCAFNKAPDIVEMKDMHRIKGNDPYKVYKFLRLPLKSGESFSVDHTHSLSGSAESLSKAGSLSPEKATTRSSDSDTDILSESSCEEDEDETDLSIGSPRKLNYKEGKKTEEIVTAETLASMAEKPSPLPPADVGDGEQGKGLDLIQKLLMKRHILPRVVGTEASPETAPPATLSDHQKASPEIHQSLPPALLPLPYLGELKRKHDEEFNLRKRPALLPPASGYESVEATRPVMGMKLPLAAPESFMKPIEPPISSPQLSPSSVRSQGRGRGHGIRGQRPSTLPLPPAIPPVAPPSNTFPWIVDNSQKWIENPLRHSMPASLRNNTKQASIRHLLPSANRQQGRVEPMPVTASQKSSIVCDKDMSKPPKLVPITPSLLPLLQAVQAAQQAKQQSACTFMSDTGMYKLHSPTKDFKPPPQEMDVRVLELRCNEPKVYDVCGPRLPPKVPRNGPMDLRTSSHDDIRISTTPVPREGVRVTPDGALDLSVNTKPSPNISCSGVSSPLMIDFSEGVNNRPAHTKSPKPAHSMKSLIMDSCVMDLSRPVSTGAPQFSTGGTVVHDSGIDLSCGQKTEQATGFPNNTSVTSTAAVADDSDSDDDVELSDDEKALIVDEHFSAYTIRQVELPYMDGCGATDLRTGGDTLRGQKLKPAAPGRGLRFDPSRPSVCPAVSSSGGKMSNPRQRLRPWLESMIDSRAIEGLCWLDDERALFRIPWKHGGKQDWTPEQAQIFMEWAKHTGRYREGIDEADYAMWKTRLRCAFNKANDIQEVKDRTDLHCADPHRVYWLKPRSEMQQEIEASLMARGVLSEMQQDVKASSMARETLSFPQAAILPMAGQTSDGPMVPVVVEEMQQSHCGSSLQTEWPTSEGADEHFPHESEFLEAPEPSAEIEVDTTENNTWNTGDSAVPMVKLLPSAFIPAETSIVSTEDITSATHTSQSSDGTNLSETFYLPMPEPEIPTGRVFPQGLNPNFIKIGRQKIRDGGVTPHTGTAGTMVVSSSVPIVSATVSPTVLREIPASSSSSSGVVGLVTVNTAGLPALQQSKSPCLQSPGPRADILQPLKSDIKVMRTATETSIMVVDKQQPHILQGHEMLVELQYSNKTQSQFFVHNPNGCRISSVPPKMEIPQDKIETVYGPQNVSQVIFNAPHPGLHMSNTDLMKARLLLQFIERGVVLESKDGDIFATRLCQCGVHYASAMNAGGEAQKLKRAERKVKIFDYNEQFLPALEAFQRGAGPTPTAEVVLMFGQLCALQELGESMLISAVVTSCRAQGSLAPQGEDTLMAEFHISGPDEGDELASQFRSIEPVPSPVSQPDADTSKPML